MWQHPQWGDRRIQQKEPSLGGPDRGLRRQAALPSSPHTLKSEVPGNALGWCTLPVGPLKNFFFKAFENKNLFPANFLSSFPVNLAHVIKINPYTFVFELEFCIL